MSRAQMRNFAAVVLTGLFALRLLGYPDWGPWAQLLAPLPLLLAATFTAPELFGWRDHPRDTRTR